MELKCSEERVDKLELLGKNGVSPMQIERLCCRIHQGEKPIKEGAFSEGLPYLITMESGVQTPWTYWGLDQRNERHIFTRPLNETDLFI